MVTTIISTVLPQVFKEEGYLFERPLIERHSAYLFESSLIDEMDLR